MTRKPISSQPRWNPGSRETVIKKRVCVSNIVTSCDVPVTLILNVFVMEMILPLKNFAKQKKLTFFPLYGIVETERFPNAHCNI